jgi:hypothetical protein
MARMSSLANCCIVGADLLDVLLLTVFAKGVLELVFTGLF